MRNIGVISMGIKTPIIREGDDLADIVVNSVLEATWDGYNKVYDINDKDVIGITESVVARAQGNYVTIDEIAEEIKTKYNFPKTIVVDRPIYSRNRFSMILKAIARAASERVVITMPEFDEVGNPSGTNPWTGVDIEKYYFDIIENEGCVAEFMKCEDIDVFKYCDESLIIYCGLHDYNEMNELFGKIYDNYITLADICSDKCEWGLLGSNKASEERLKLFPNKEKTLELVEEVQKLIQDTIKERQGTDINVHVCVYGDGAFKDPVAEIWEFADPITMPAYTSCELFESSPDEIKIKYLADNKYSNLSGIELNNAIQKEIETHKGNSLKGNMISEGTTPRLYRDLLASLMDLTTGSGMRATPVVLIKNYFN